MPSSHRIIFTLAIAAIATVEAAFGPAFSTAPVATDSWIREAESTLVLPKAPSGSTGDASVWLGMGTSYGGLIQSISDNSQSSHWSEFPYTLVSTSATTQAVVEGVTSTADAGDHVTSHYKYDDASGNYKQTVLVNDKIVSTLSTSDDHAQGFGSAVECAADDCGTIPAHYWLNTTIILDVADPDYVNTLCNSDGVTGDMVTADGGKTWTVRTIDIPEFTLGARRSSETDHLEIVSLASGKLLLWRVGMTTAYCSST